MAKKRVDQLMEQGIAALKAGDKKEAERLLRQAVVEDAQNEFAWLWLSGAVKGIQRQRDCLNKVIEINPINAHARQGLAFLNKLRDGQEWRAEKTPWIEGLEEAQAKASQVHCPRCGTVNASWAGTCSRCGAPLQHVDLVESVRAEEQVRSRADVSTTVIESWAGVIPLQREQIFQAEAELASVGRSIAAIILGVLLIMLVRFALALVPPIQANQDMLDLLQTIWMPTLLELGTFMGSAFGVYLILTIITLPLVLVGKNGIVVQSHMGAMAISSWLFLATIGILVLRVPGFFLSGQSWIDLRGILHIVVIAVLALYGFILLAQTLQTMQDLNIVLSVILAGLLVAVCAGLYFPLASAMPEVPDFLQSLWQSILSPVAF